MMNVSMASAQPAPPPREYRAVWVATVANIDWPSEPGLSTEKQKQEALDILNTCDDLNVNAIVFQVRPHADALYESEIEPWSFYLTGEQGAAPDPFYDPLQFWIEESHKRGMELHVWFNPYRAHHPATKSDIAPDHVVNESPEMVYELANGMWWLDPAQKAVQDYSYEVMLDVVRRYDVDGAHMDDYFYPYSSYNEGADFPDDPSWEAYKEEGGELSRADWRRKAVNDFVERLYKGIKEEKPWVKFGISPFGIWRPGHPPSIQGLDQYNALYADAKLWLNEGWVDYYTPQLYWPVNQIPQSFPVLLGWWKEQNLKNRNLWPGMGTHNIAGGSFTIDEIYNQIMVTRGMIRNGPGHTHFSVKHLQNNEELAEILAEGPYAKPALVPPSPWLDDEAPAAPRVKLDEKNGWLRVWMAPGDEEDPAFLYVVYEKRGGNWSYQIVSGMEDGLSVQARSSENKEVSPLEAVAVAAVDRTGNLGELTTVPVESE